MLKNNDIQHALSDIKDLMQKNINLVQMKNNILKLTNLVENDYTQNTTSNTKKSLSSSLDELQFTDQQLTDNIKEILRPYLKTWLDNNLPAIVKEVVEHQIKIIMDESNKN